MILQLSGRNHVYIRFYNYLAETMLLENTVASYIGLPATNTHEVVDCTTRQCNKHSSKAHGFEGVDASNSVYIRINDLFTLHILLQMQQSVHCHTGTSGETL